MTAATAATAALPLTEDTVLDVLRGRSLDGVELMEAVAAACGLDLEEAVENDDGLRYDAMIDTLVTGHMIAYLPARGGWTVI